jgi:hypothetical protein
MKHRLVIQIHNSDSINPEIGSSSKLFESRTVFL